MHSLGAVATPLLAQLDALLDELTVLTMEQSGSHRATTKTMARSRAFVAWPAIEQRLKLGPAQSTEIGLIVYGAINTIITEQRRKRLTDAMTHRLVRAGIVVRIRRGMFALPSRDYSPITLNTLRVLLTKRALTTPEIAAQLNLGVPTAYRWVRRLRDAGEPLVYTLVSGTTRPMQRWHITTTVTETAA